MAGKDDRRDNTALIASISAFQNALQTSMNNGFDAINERLKESHEERRKAEDKIWQALDDHYGRKETSHHASLDKKVDLNSDAVKSARTTLWVLAIVWGTLWGGVVFLKEKIISALSGHW